jgi:hypothetical protein
MGGDNFESQNFPDRLFTSLGFVEIIPGYLHKSPPLVFLARLKTLHHGRVFLEKSI